MTLPRAVGLVEAELCTGGGMPVARHGFARTAEGVRLNSQGQQRGHGVGGMLRQKVLSLFVGHGENHFSSLFG